MRKQKSRKFKLRLLKAPQLSSGEAGVCSHVCLTSKPRFLNICFTSSTEMWALRSPPSSQDGDEGQQESCKMADEHGVWEFVANLLQFILGSRQYSYSVIRQTKSNKVCTFLVTGLLRSIGRCQIILTNFLFSGSFVLVCFQELQNPPH